MADIDFNSYSAVIDFKRQNITSDSDVYLKSIPAL